MTERSSEQKRRPWTVPFVAAIVVLALYLGWRWVSSPGRPAGQAAKQTPVALPPAQPQSLAPEKAAGLQTIPRDLRAVADAGYESYWFVWTGRRDAQKRQRQTVQELGLPLEVCTAKTGIVLRLIPAGTFTMGSPSGEWGRDSDEVPHQVTLTKAFYCGKFEVTQGQWEQVMGSNPSYFKNAGKDAPVEWVSWDDCQAFVRKLCQMEGVLEGTYRLLTEAEWEYACRAGTQTPFCYRNDPSSSMANFNGEYPYGDARKWTNRRKTVVGKGFMPNAWGLYHMHGNVCEWCQDWCGNYASGAVADPLGPPSGVNRVSRGGGYCDASISCRSADRDGQVPYYRNWDVGFRLARTTPSKP